MLNSKASRITLFLIIPIIIAILSFFYNFAGLLFTAGPVTLGHTEFKNSCFKCHAIFSSISSACLDCHEKIDEKIKKEIGFHATMDKKKVKKCLKCHSDHSGERYLVIDDARTDEELMQDIARVYEKNKIPAKRIPKEPRKGYGDLWKNVDQENFDLAAFVKELEKKFDHNLTGYPLTGKHREVKCEKCHSSLKEFKESDKNGIFPDFTMKQAAKKEFCFSCHKKDDKGKKGHKGKYGKDCGSCHLTGGAPGSKKGFKILRSKIREHHKDKKHKLEGKHAKTECQKCHERTPLKKKKEETTCFACHEPIDKKIHKKSLGKKCEECHVPAENFRKKVKFDHQKTKFALYYGHKKASCTKCHPKWNTKKEKAKVYDKIKNMTCNDCHAIDDIHHGAFKTDCERCHRETYWGDVIDH